MAGLSRTVDEKIALLAARSHGVVTRKRLLAAGISDDEIRSRIKRGTLIQVHRGVYRVGHAAPSLHATYLAAVLACGEGALLCGTAAAYLMRLFRFRTPPPPQVLTRTERKIAGIETIRTRAKIRGWTYDGIPCTTVPRTLADLAPLLSLDDLARACHEAGGRYRTTPRQVERERRANAPGAAKLRAALRGEAPVTLSVLERRFLERLDAAGLRRPDETNRVASGRRVDCRWLAERLTVELDSYTWHNSRHAWENDRRREREAYARGDAFRRYTYGDVFEDPQAMLTELAGLLTRR